MFSQRCFESRSEGLGNLLAFVWELVAVEPGESLTDFPDFPGHRIVPCARRDLPNRAVGKVPAAELLNAFLHGTVNDGLSSIGRSSEEQEGDGEEQELTDDAQVTKRISEHKTRMHGVAGHVGALQPVGQLPGKEHVAQLAGAVAAQAADEASCRGGEVGEVHSAQAVGHGGDHHDTARSTLLQAVQEQASQQEVAKVVNSPCSIESICSQANCSSTCVVNQQM